MSVVLIQFAMGENDNGQRQREANDDREQLTLTIFFDVHSLHTMERINHHLTKVQLTSLRALSKQTGLTVAELIRRAVDAYLKREATATGGNR